MNGRDGTVVSIYRGGVECGSKVRVWRARPRGGGREGEGEKVVVDE